MKSHHITVSVAIMASALLATAGLTQDSSTYYSVTHPEGTKTSWRVFYDVADKLTAAARADLRSTLDIPYGPDPREKLDVYQPRARLRKAPVLIFLHGGNFVEGDRTHYGYVAADYAKRGVITVVPSYRLVRDGHVWPQQTDDAKAVISWAYRNIASFGGDPQAIVIAGHSVGATMAAEIGVDRAWMQAAGIPKTAVRGVVLISGRFLVDESDPFLMAYAPTATARAQASAASRILDPVPRAIVSYGANEGARVQASDEFEAALRGHGVATDLIRLPGGTHGDAVLDFAEAKSRQFAATMAMFSPKR